MHTTKSGKNNIRLHHNGDFSGEAYFVDAHGNSSEINAEEFVDLAKQVFARHTELREEEAENSPQVVVTAEQQKDLGRRFSHHPPGEGGTVSHEGVRFVCKEAANYILRSVPPGREQSLALTKLEEAMFWANAGIAREED